MFPVDGGTEVKGKQSGGGGGAAAGQTERPYGWKGERGNNTNRGRGTTQV